MNRLPTIEEVWEWDGAWKITLCTGRSVTTRLRIEMATTRHGEKEMPVIVDPDPMWDGIPIVAFYDDGGEVERADTVPDGRVLRVR